MNFSQFWIEICDYTVVCTYDLYIPGCLLACFLIHTNVKICGIVVHWIPSLLNTCLLTIFKQLLKIFYECLIILVSQLQGRRKIRNLEKQGSKELSPRLLDKMLLKLQVISQNVQNTRLSKFLKCSKLKPCKIIILKYSYDTNDEIISILVNARTKRKMQGRHKKLFLGWVGTGYQSA